MPDWLAYLLQFKSYAALFVCAAVGTAVLTPLYYRVAQRVGWVDRPYGRKRHGRPTATMGGLVIFAVVFAGTLVSLNLNNLVGDMLRAKSRYVYGILACTAFMLLLGIVDDRRGVRAKVKFLVQIVVAVFAVLVGFQIKAITLPVSAFETVHVPPILGALASLLWIVGITNAINLTDGIDGLAAGICLLAAGVNAIVAIWLGNYYMTVMMVLLAGALLGFLRWNFHPARVFLGDTGSLALGMFLALASLQSAQKAHTVVLILVPLFALGYPIFDTLLAVGRRIVRGQPLFSSDRDHIHHRLMDRGQSPSKAAGKIYLGSIVLSGVCIAAVTANHFILGVAIVGVLLLALFSVRVLGYMEWGSPGRRWSGRQETKALHAAAALARIKIDQADGLVAVVRALAILAPEVGCRRIEASCKEETQTWSEPAAADSPPSQPVEVQADDTVRVCYTLAGSTAPDAERQILLEELAWLAGARLNQLAAIEQSRN